MEKPVRTIFMMAAMLLSCISALGQATQFKAMYLYKFAKGVSWPSDASSGDFVITIVGDNEMATVLSKQVSSRKIGSRSIVVKQVATVPQIEKSHMVYLGESKSDQIQKLIEMQGGNKVLIVAGKGGWCEHGAGISFVNKGGAISYEVSSKNIQQRGLTVSQEVTRSGINVD